jgi:Mn-containing catalase
MIAMAAAVCVLTVWLICLVADRESREVVDYICQRDEVCTMEWRRPVSTTARTADASK